MRATGCVNEARDKFYPLLPLPGQEKLRIEPKKSWGALNMDANAWAMPFMRPLPIEEPGLKSQGSLTWELVRGWSLQDWSRVVEERCLQWGGTTLGTYPPG